VRKGKRARTRIRRSIPEIYESLGPQYFCRAYQMTYESFCKLHDLLSDGIATAVAATRRQTTTNRKPNCRPPVPNGARILSSVCLGCALRYFAGGAPYDLMVKFGISQQRLWIVSGLLFRPSTSSNSFSSNTRLNTTNKSRLHQLSATQVLSLFFLCWSH
jgi:hypothetical protein